MSVVPTPSLAHGVYKRVVGALLALGARAMGTTEWCRRALHLDRPRVIVDCITKNISTVVSNGSEDAGETGEFYFKGAILDQLNVYFSCLRRMRRHDPDAYELYRQIGATVLPEHAITYKSEALDPWFVTTKPTFGAVVWTDAQSEMSPNDLIPPRMLYFSKCDASRIPPYVERRTGGDTYLVTVLWDTGAFIAPAEFPIHIGNDGTLTVLKCRLGQTIHVRATRGSDRGRSFAIARHHWGFHQHFIEWARRHHEPVEDLLREFFILIANSIQLANSSMIRVQVDRDGLRGLFPVNIKRTPYFFKDRDITLTHNGSRRKIFHIVRPHRRMQGGKEVYVRLHFRGEREFAWNGYSIKITVPGRDHLHLSEFNVRGRDKRFTDRGAALNMPEVGRLMRARILNETVGTS